MGQDYIFKKDSTVLNAKVLEVNVDKIKFKRLEILDGPVYEIYKTEVWKVRYHNKFEDIFDTTFAKKIAKYMVGFKIDTTKFSMIYIISDPSISEYLNFPVYFNEQFIGWLNKHSRISAKIYSQGLITISRSPNPKEKIKIDLVIKTRQKYAVILEMPLPNSYNKSKKYRLSAFSKEADIKTFLQNYFMDFNPKNLKDKVYEEDLKNPVI